jgi:hypothetical protein
VHPSRPPARCRTPASSALLMPADAQSRRSAAATTSSSVGRAVAATTRRPSAAPGGSAASRGPSNSWRSSGTGSGSPGAGRTPWLVRARTISRAKSGFPSEIRCSRTRMGRVRSPSARSLSRRVIASSPNGPMGTPLEWQQTRLTQTERVAAGTNAQRRQNPDRRILQTTDHERQHPGRRRIQPLDVVDRDNHRTGRGQRAQNPQRRDRHGSLVRWSALDFGSEEGRVQGPLLGGREIGQLEVEEVTKRRVGEAGLRFRRAAGQHPMTACPRDGHARAPPCRLADPGRPLQEQGRRSLRHRPDERLGPEHCHPVRHDSGGNTCNTRTATGRC